MYICSYRGERKKKKNPNFRKNLRAEETHFGEGRLIEEEAICVKRERMKRKREEEELQQKSSKKLGDGVAWFRGTMIGKGCFGSVYLANLKKPRSKFGYLPSIFAVKSGEVSVSGSIQKEREVFNNIPNCPFVIKCFGEEITRGESGEMVFNLLLEYGSGGTLAGLIEKSGGKGLPESDVKRFTRSILRGVNCIHECGYVHCDIKPENILLVEITECGVTKLKAKIGDLGLAKRANQRKKMKFDDPYLRGTPMYLSPEALIDNIQEPPSDIWALGCVVLEMLTGKPPWDSKHDLDHHRLPEIPSEISKEGKEFLKGCFVRKDVYRWTAEMLLTHPFVGLVDEDGDFEEEEALNVDFIDLSLPLLVTDDRLSSSSSDDWDFVSEDELSYYSLSEEDSEDLDEEVVSIYDEEYALEIEDTSTKVLSNTKQQCPVNLTIPAGV